MADTGLVDPGVFLQNSRAYAQSGAKSGALAAADDAGLQRLIDAWPTLPPDVRRAVLAMLP
jgi:hypothetical protein